MLQPWRWPLLVTLLASLYLRAFNAASQSNGERTERALKGDWMGESTFPAAGEGGILMLANVVAPVAGADSGWLAGGDAGALAALAVGDLWMWSQSHEHSLASLVAVDGALSASSPSALSSAVPSDEADFVLSLDSDVEVLLSLDFAHPAVGGGLARTGLASFRKSRYATGGVMGVLANASSVLTMATALNGEAMPADGRPADGRPAEASGSRSTDESGVLRETAEARASAGKDAVTGVVSAGSLGLVVEDMMTRRRCRRSMLSGPVKQMTWREQPATGWNCQVDLPVDRGGEAGRVGSCGGKGWSRGDWKGGRLVILESRWRVCKNRRRFARR